MKVQIRRNVFETNSSSVHSITMCSGDEYKKWENGELLFDRWSEEFVDANDPKIKEARERYVTYDEFWEDCYYETFEETYTTKTGETVVTFGYYGHD